LEVAGIFGEIIDWDDNGTKRSQNKMAKARLPAMLAPRDI
jgi:hypothetical protein